MTKFLTALMFVALAITGTAPAHADPVNPGDVCTGFDLGQSPGQIWDGMQHNDGRVRGPQQQWDVYGPIISGDCDQQQQ